MLIEGTYQINFFGVGVVWFWKGVQKNFERNQNVLQKKNGEGVSLFCSEMAHGALRFSFSPAPAFGTWDAINQAPNSPLTTPT
jgi:hypothetical protein